MKGGNEAGTIYEKDLELFHISNDKNDTFKCVTSFIEEYQLKE